jgi:hypothetical protein
VNASSASRKAQAIVNRLHRENPGATDYELAAAFADVVSKDDTLKGIEYPDGHVTEDWLCVDCGVNTAPGIPDGATVLKQLNDTGSSPAQVGPDTEVYTVRNTIWKKAGMEPFGGCLCVGCLERRLGRKLKPKDFLRGHSFNEMPGSERLLKRQKRRA